MIVKESPVRIRHAVPASRWTLIGLEVLMAVMAVYGGIGLLTDSLGMPAEWLAGTAFGSWVLPGVFLLLTVAAPLIAAAVMELRAAPGAGWLSLSTGVILIGWIIVQLAVFQRYFILQPIVQLFGLAIILLALATHATLRPR